METYTAAPDVDIVTSPFEIPGYGSIAVNCFVLKGAEPLIVDTGAVVMADEYMDAIRSVVDPAELRWIWLTHTDFDHIGNLHRLLAENPEIRVITNFLGVGIMSTSAPLPMDRVRLVNPGQSITVGDHTLRAFKPPIFDNPSTMGFHDESSGILYSSDCFGALVQEVPRFAADLSDEDRREGQTLWATIDSPWLHKTDTGLLAKELNEIRSLAPSMILSSHLPPAAGDLTDALIEAIEAAPTAQPFVGPDQAALEAMMKEMTG